MRIGEKPGAKLPLDSVIVGDCIEALNRLPEASIDLVFADPPYNLQLNSELYRPDNSRVDAVDDDWDKFASFAAYDAFTRRLALGLPPRAEASGLDLGDRQLSQHLPRRRRLAGSRLLGAQRRGLAQVQSRCRIFAARRFTNAHETLIWASMGPRARYTFNYEAMKALNDDLQMRSDWLFPICSGAERLREEGGRKTHPTQKPEALLHRIILSSTHAGDVVLDPFFGSGTTGGRRQAARPRLHRHRTRRGLRRRRRGRGFDLCEAFDRDRASGRERQEGRAAHPVRRAGRAWPDRAGHRALRPGRAA